MQNYKMYKKFEIKNIISNFTGQNVNIKLIINMELKKSPKADLGNKKLLFLEIGSIFNRIFTYRIYADKKIS